MRDWSLAPGDPLCLTLAADARLSIPDYLNDHIWELIIGGGEPPALSLQTTYGLRAKAMRVFLRFSENGKSISDPSAFALPPTIRRFYPNFLILDYSPLKNIDVITEYWVPQSNVLSGRVSVSNRTSSMRKIRLEVCAVLSPIDGQSMTSTQTQMVNVLAGQTGGLFPVLFMTGGPAPGSGPYPSLFLDLDLGPGATRTLTWVQAATDNLQSSFDLARQSSARPWEAEKARLELLNSSQTIDIRTGDKDWDAAFALSQSAAFGLFCEELRALGVFRQIIAVEPTAGLAETCRKKGIETLQAPIEQVTLAEPVDVVGTRRHLEPEPRRVHRATVPTCPRAF